MTYQETIDALKKLGTEPLRTKAIADGAGENTLGVSPVKMTRLAKKINADQKLAVELWNSSIADAQILATMIADVPASVELLEAWIKGIHYQAVADAFVTNIVAKTSVVKEKMSQWIKSSDEFVLRCGYRVMEHLAQSDASIPDSEFQDYLFGIRNGIQTAANRAREGMYHALIAIGKRNKRLNMEAIMTASEVGKVYIESGGKMQALPSAMEILADKELRATLT